MECGEEVEDQFFDDVHCELCAADREADKQLSSLAGGRRLEAESECNWIPLHTRAIGAREERT